MKTPEPLSTERLYELCELSKTSPQGKDVKISWDELWALVEMAKERKVIVPQSFDEFIEAIHDAGWRGIHDAQHEHIRALYDKRT